MILNNDQLPCIYAWMCLSARLSLFDHFLTTAAVLDQKNSQKCQFYGFLRHFRAFKKNFEAKKFSFWYEVIKWTLGRPKSLAIMTENFFLPMKASPIAWRNLESKNESKLLSLKITNLHRKWEIGKTKNMGT